MTGKRRASAGNPREGQWIPPVFPDPDDKRNRRPAPKHYAGEDPAEPKAPSKRAKAAKAPASPISAPTGARQASPTPPPRLARRSSGGAGRAATDEVRNFANRSAYLTTQGKPSVTGRAVSGGAAGAASGAALGSVVPGVGTAAGAVAGGTVGAAGGAVAGRRAKKAYKTLTRSNGHVRRLLVAEFLLCLVIVGLSPLTQRRKDEPPGTWMKRMTAVLGLFFVLGLLSAGGLAGLASGLGALVTVVLMVSERNVFAAIASAVSGPSSAAPGPGPTADEAVGGAENPDEVAPIGGVGFAEGPGSVTPISSWR